MPIRSSTCVQKSIPADYLKVGIREQGEGQAGTTPKLGRNVGRVYADRHRPDTFGLKVGKSLLNAPQLEDAEWSPISAIKDQQHRLRRRIFT
jgi:hypothetical protein